MTDWVDASLGVYFESDGSSGQGADCTAALQSAINTAARSVTSRGNYFGGRLTLGPGRFRITDTINIFASRGCMGLTIEGSSAGYAGAGTATQILWDSPDPTKPMFRLWSRDCIVRGLTVGPMAGRTLYAAFDETADTQSGGNICTTNLFEHVSVSSYLGAGTTLLNGWIHGAARNGSADPSDCENTNWIRCAVLGFTQNGIWCPNITGQSMNCRVDRASFMSAGGAGGLAGSNGVNWRTGGVTMNHCDFGNVDVAVRSGALNQLSLENCLSEGCSRLMVSGGLFAGGAAVQIRGGRFSAQNMAADGQYIQFQGGGSLLLDGIYVDQSYLPAFGVSAYNTMPHAASVTAIGCGFPNLAPIIDPRMQWPGFTYGQQLTMIGCFGAQPGGEAFPIPFTNELRQGP